MPVTFMPMAFPRADSGKERERRAMEVPKIMPPPMPVRNLAPIRNGSEGERRERTEETRYTPMPATKTFFTPCRSAILPIGRRKTAAERKKTFVSQPRETAPTENSSAMAGRATTRAETMKGARDDPRTDARSTCLLPASETMGRETNSSVVILSIQGRPSSPALKYPTVHYSSMLMRIGGKEVGSAKGTWLDVINPATGEVLDRVPAGGEEEIGMAVEAGEH